MEPELHINMETGQLGWYEPGDVFLPPGDWRPFISVSKKDLAKRIQDIAYELWQLRYKGGHFP